MLMFLGQQGRIMRGSELCLFSQVFLQRDVEVVCRVLLWFGIESSSGISCFPFQGKIVYGIRIHSVMPGVLWIYLFVCVSQTNCVILPVAVKIVWIDHCRDRGYLEGFLEQDGQNNHQGRGGMGQASLKIEGKAYAITRNPCHPLQVFRWVWRGQRDLDNKIYIKVSKKPWMSSRLSWSLSSGMQEWIIRQKKNFGR